MTETTQKKYTWRRELARAWFAIRRFAVVLLIALIIFTITGWLSITAAVLLFTAIIAGALAVGPGPDAPATYRFPANIGPPGAEPHPMPATAIDLIPDPVVCVALGGETLYANQAAKGVAVAALLRGPEVYAAVRAALQEGKTSFVEHAQAAPVSRFYTVHVTPMQPPGDSPRAAILTLRDLTAEKRIDRMRTDFVANVSHEINTPLSSLLGCLETLDGPAQNDPAARARFLDLMAGQAERMRRLVEDLLSLGRIEWNEHVPPTGVVNLAALAADVRDAMAPRAQAAGIRVRLQQEHAPDIRGDHDDLSRLLQNLLDNAITHGAAPCDEKTEASGADRADVEIAFKDDMLAGRPAVRMSMTDHGPGIGREHLPRLTERFYRAGASAPGGKQGAGLGLAIVKHIVSRHGGLLHLDSTPGQGFRADVTLPAIAEDRE